MIIAVAILHNLAIEMKLPLPDVGGDESSPLESPNEEFAENPNAVRVSTAEAKYNFAFCLTFRYFLIFFHAVRNRFNKGQ